MRYIEEVATDEEIMEVAKRFANSKASGIYGIPNKVPKHAIKLKPAPFTKLYTQCLRERIFPKICKKNSD